jgi:hypothetical protein
MHRDKNYRTAARIAGTANFLGEQLLLATAELAVIDCLVR